MDCGSIAIDKWDSATNTYFLAGVDRVWVVDTKAQSVTIFRRNELLQIIKADGSISDSLLPELMLPVARIFAKTPQGSWIRRSTNAWCSGVCNPVVEQLRSELSLPLVEQ